MPFYSLLHILRGWHMSFVPCVDERELRVVVDYAMFGRTAGVVYICVYIYIDLVKQPPTISMISTSFMVYSNVSRSNRLWCPYPFDSSNDMVLSDNIGDLHKCHDLPSGKRLHNHGKSPCLMGKSTISMISMAMFNSYVSHYQRVYPINIPLNHYKIPLNDYKSRC